MNCCCANDHTILVDLSYFTWWTALQLNDLDYCLWIVHCVMTYKWRKLLSQVFSCDDVCQNKTNIFIWKWRCQQSRMRRGIFHLLDDAMLLNKNITYDALWNLVGSIFRAIVAIHHNNDLLKLITSCEAYIKYTHMSQIMWFNKMSISCWLGWFFFVIYFCFHSECV